MPPNAASAIGLAGAHVCVGRMLLPMAAPHGIRMLDDGRRRLAELQHDACSGVEIEQVRVGQLLALQHACGAEARRRLLRVPGRHLMRVLAVSQVADLVQSEGEGRRATRSSAARTKPDASAVMVSSVDAIGGVVAAGVRERLLRQIEAESRARPAAAVELLQHGRIVARRHDHEDILRSSWRRRGRGWARRCRSPR